jgi:hypothetical protein
MLSALSSPLTAEGIPNLYSRFSAIFSIIADGLAIMNTRGFESWLESKLSKLEAEARKEGLNISHPITPFLCVIPLCLCLFFVPCCHSGDSKSSPLHGTSLAVPRLVTEVLTVLSLGMVVTRYDSLL